MNEPIAIYIEFRYIGEGAFLNGVPARDLTGMDLVDVEAREGIGPEVIAACGLYERVKTVEVAPFCGAVLRYAEAATQDGPAERCREPVEEWGQRCEVHQEGIDGDGTA